VALAGFGQETREVLDALGGADPHGMGARWRIGPAWPCPCCPPGGRIASWG
jgi:hypothetical protein